MTLFDYLDGLLFELKTNEIIFYELSDSMLEQVIKSLNETDELENVEILIANRFDAPRRSEIVFKNYSSKIKIFSCFKASMRSNIHLSYYEENEGIEFILWTWHNKNKL